MQRDLPNRRDVVLVAHEPPDCEHLGIRLVAAGLAEAGFRPRVLPLRSPASMAAVVEETLARRPFLVGVSLSDPLVAPPILAYVRLLRLRGFVGHITVGGALATLERARLLADHPALDSVVRHAGEAVIVELARALDEDGDLSVVPGLTTRAGEGSGNPHAFSASRLRPLRAAEPPTLLGIPKADVAASRGCAGRCVYCGIPALERDLEGERRMLGLPAAKARGGIQRPLDDLADEVAALYHDRGVRVVQLVDDNLLGSEPRQARAWLADLEAGLRRRRVGPMAWRLMAEPGVLTEDVVDALARLGALFVLVGVESLTPQGKSALGRRGGLAGDLAALHRLAGHGITPSLNVLALRPGGTLADAQAELALLDQLDDFPWEVVPLTVWPGTLLAEQLAGKHELAGQGAGLAWLPTEPAVERFIFALNRLRMGGLAWVARLPCALDVLFALRVARRLGLPGSGPEPIERAQTVLAQAQRIRRGILEKGMALATADLAASEFGQAVEALHRQAADQLAPFDERFGRLLDEVTWPPAAAMVTGLSRRLASPWLAHGLMMAMAAGCAGSGLHEVNRPGTDAPVEQARILLPEVATIKLPEVGNVDVAQLPQAICTPDGGASGSADASCDISRLEQSVSQASGWSCQAHASPQGWAYAVVIDCDGKAVELLRLPDQTPLFTGTERQAWLDSLANDRWPCFAGQSVQFSCIVCLFP
jgi:radical SAM superfamily enzyme YgiQ (UPF0313 family)